MIKRTTPFLCILVSLLSSCGSSDHSFDIRREGGTVIELECDADEFLVLESGRSKNSLFIKALQKTKESTLTGSDFIHRFAGNVTGIDPNARMVFFFHRKYKDGYDSKMTNDEVKKILLEKFESANRQNMKIIELRLENSGIKKFNINDLSNGKIIVEIAGKTDKERLSRLLSSSASIGFYETYPNGKVLSLLSDASVKLQLISELDSNEFFPLHLDMVIQPNNSREFSNGIVVTNSALIGHAELKDTSRLNYLLHHYAVKSTFPKDLHFVWGQKTEKIVNETEWLPLFAIRSPDFYSPEPDGTSIASARADFENHTNAWVINFQFNSEGSLEWEKITRKNVNKYIAIVIDGYVVCAPMVTAEIKEGKCVIQGNFTEEEAGDLATMLNSGTLPCRMRITGFTVVEPSE